MLDLSNSEKLNKIKKLQIGIGIDEMTQDGYKFEKLLCSGLRRFLGRKFHKGSGVFIN